MTEGRPNILVLMCDQLQGSKLGFIDGVAYTPHLDELAREGVHFSHATSCHGQCIPSRIGFITGKSPHEAEVVANTGQFGHHAGLNLDRHLTLSKFLTEQGYRSAFFGKSHFAADLQEMGFEAGPDYQRMDISDEEARAGGFEYAPGGARRAHHRASRDAVAWLQEYRPGPVPLFFVYSTNLPHSPIHWVPEHRHRFPVDKMQLPRSFYEETFENKPPFQREHSQCEHHSALDEDFAKLEQAQYYSMISAADDVHGRIIAEFKRLGLWDNTVVLFFSDHGDMLSSHRTRKKGTLPYEEVYHVPCIMKLPGGMQSKRPVIDDLVCSSQFAGTLVKLAGMAVPPGFTAGHFADSFERGEHPDAERVFFEHYSAYWGQHPFYAVRTRAMKYIRYYGPDDTQEMYDLQKDPDELRNVVDDPAYRSIRDKLSAEADAWWQRTGGRDFAYYETGAFKAGVARD